MDEPDPSLTEALEQHQFCYLTTTGRSSGKPHRIEIWFVVLDGCIYVISRGQRRSDWVKNLMANASVTYELGGDERQGVATFLDDSENHRARQRLAERYQGWRRGEPLTRWATEGLLIRIAPGKGE